MIRLIARRLIIPCGDTGSFNIANIWEPNAENIAVFYIYDPLTNSIILQKNISASEEILTVNFSQEDTKNVEPSKRYKWDIKLYHNPIQDENNLVISGDKIDSYFSAYKLPVCEIRR